MKNRFILLIFVLFMPIIAYADMGAPMIKPYEMVVVSGDGIDYYDYQGNVKGHLNKDDKFTVQYEYDGGYDIKIANSETTFELKNLTGTMLIQDELKPENFVKDEFSGVSMSKVSSKNKALVYAKDGVDVRKGPSTVYDKVGHLDKDVVIKYTYKLDGGGTTHIYVNSNGVKGWIDILDAKVLLETTDKYIAFKDVNLSCITVPKNTTLTGKYESDPWSHKVLVEYGSCTDLYYYFRGRDGLINMYEANYRSKDSLDIYEYYDNDGKLLGTIPNDTKFKVMASVDNPGDEYQFLYVKYNNKEGWIKTSYTKFEFINNEEGNEDTHNDSLPNNDKENEITESNDSNKVQDNTPYDMTLMYVVIGVVVALMALVTILLVNRKKKSNEEVVKTEKKIDIDTDIDE